MKKYILSLLLVILAGCQTSAPKKQGSTIALLNVNFETLNQCVRQEFKTQDLTVLSQKEQAKSAEYQLAESSVVMVSEREQKVQGYVNAIAISSYPADISKAQKDKIHSVLDHCYQQLNDPAITQEIIKKGTKKR